MLELKVLFGFSIVISILCGILAEDPDSLAVSLHRALLGLAVALGFLITWGKM